jgi:hypothetical protein
MKKFYLLLFTLVTISCFVSAQQQGVSLGGNIMLPVGDWDEIANTGFGGSASFEQPVATNLLGVLYTGYTYFDGAAEGFSWTLIPVVAGLKYYLSSQQDWYFIGLLGINITNSTYKLGESEATQSFTDFEGNANFGYEIKTSESGALDLSAGFVFINEQSYVGMRLAYIFKL